VGGMKNYLLLILRNPFRLLLHVIIFLFYALFYGRPIGPKRFVRIINQEELPEGGDITK
jgi:hypothetical protein